IEPELDIHDILTVDPGLTLIAMDYGWSRAAEECTGATAEMRRRTRAVYELRRSIWSAEDLALRPHHSTDNAEDRAGAGAAAAGTAPAAAGAAGAAAAGSAAGAAAAVSAAGAGATAQRTRAALDQIGELKLQLRQLVTEAGPTLLPPQAPTWWRDVEPHPYAVDIEPHWLP